VRDEWDLLRFCTDNKVPIERLFTRYYLEGIFSPNASGPRKGARYLTPGEIALPQRRWFWQRIVQAPPPKVVEHRQFWELDHVTIKTGDSVLIPTDAGSPIPQDAVLLIDLSQSSGTLAVEETKSGARSVIDLAMLGQARLPIWHTRAAVPLGTSIGGIYRVQPEGGSWLTCQGALLLYRRGQNSIFNSLAAISVACASG
jgi:hypothetical protein